MNDCSRAECTVSRPEAALSPEVQPASCLLRPLHCQNNCWCDSQVCSSNDTRGASAAGHQQKAKCEFVLKRSSHWSVTYLEDGLRFCFWLRVGLFSKTVALREQVLEETVSVNANFHSDSSCFWVSLNQWAVSGVWPPGLLGDLKLLIHLFIYFCFRFALLFKGLITTFSKWNKTFCFHLTKWVSKNVAGVRPATLCLVFLSSLKHCCVCRGHSRLFFTLTLISWVRSVMHECWILHVLHHKCLIMDCYLCCIQMLFSFMCFSALFLKNVFGLKK